MTPTNDDRVEKTLINLIACHIKLFLMEQRRFRRNDGWFSIEHIADELKLRSDLIPYYLALKQLAANPNIEPLNGGIRWSA